MEGNFDFEAIICNLFSEDFDHKDTDISKNDFQDLSWLRLFVSKVNKNGEAFPIENLDSKSLTSDVTAKLLHERIHYWQAISTPFFQMRFINNLDLLRIQVENLNGKIINICGEAFVFESFSQEDLNYIQQVGAAISSNFLSANITIDMIQGINKIAADSPTALGFVFLPSVDGTDNPGYVGLLGLDGNDQYSIIPFTGNYLLESAAYISQCLYEHKSIPRLDSKENYLPLYLGAWEFWRRTHESRYNSEMELALGFLAAVDLTLVADIIEFDAWDLNEKYELISIPYRFGKIVYTSQGIPPLKYQGGEPSEAITKFQEDFCRYKGWSIPAVSIKKSAIFLTRLLFQACAWHNEKMQQDDRVPKLVECLFDSSISEIADRFESMETVWSFLNEFQTDSSSIGLWPLGRRILGIMLNACFYRLKNPGEFAAPHFYADKIRTDFPLPLIQLGGRYYYDGHVSGALKRSKPYLVNTLGLIGDCLGLITLSPLQRGRNKCGFIEKIIDCAFIKNGLGCPQQVISNNQHERRNHIGLFDRCHWTLRTHMLGIAPEDDMRRWESYMI